MTRLIIALFVLTLPLLEIAGFIVVGRWIGVWPTLLLVMASVVVGLAILRRQGMQTVSRLRQRRLPQDMPAERFLSAAMVLLAGLLLIVPGFVSDVVALVLLTPFVRSILARHLASRLVVVNFETGVDPAAGRPAAPRTIDLEKDDFSREDRP